MDSIIGSTVDNQWTIIKKISSGSFGIVFLAENVDSKQNVAVKLEREEQEDVKALFKEIELLTLLNGVTGVPKFLWSGK